VLAPTKKGRRTWLGTPTGLAQLVKFQFMLGRWVFQPDPGTIPAMVLHCERRLRDAADCGALIVAADTALWWAALILVVIVVLSPL
jgi:hypothetical protein